jgi:hypothetical protein
MTQADSVLSTPPINTPIAGATSRRNFLTTAAGIAAGGTSLALAIVPASAVFSGDPVFAAIQEHNEIYARLRAAEAAHALVERELNASGDLFPQVISQGNPYSGLARPVSKTHEQIDMYTPADLYPGDNRREHAELEAAISRRDAIHIPSQEAMDATWEAERVALEELVETVPTTMPGVMALLKWHRDLWEIAPQSLEAEHLSYLCESAETALLNLQSV